MKKKFIPEVVTKGMPTTNKEAISPVVVTTRKTNDCKIYPIQGYF